MGGPKFHISGYFSGTVARNGTQREGTLYTEKKVFIEMDLRMAKVIHY